MPPPLSKPMANGGARHAANQVGAGAPLPAAALLSLTPAAPPQPDAHTAPTTEGGTGGERGAQGQGLPAKGRAERAEERRWEGPAA